MRSGVLYHNAMCGGTHDEIVTAGSTCPVGCRARNLENLLAQRSKQDADHILSSWFEVLTSNDALESDRKQDKEARARLLARVLKDPKLNAAQRKTIRSLLYGKLASTYASRVYFKAMGEKGAHKNPETVLERVRDFAGAHQNTSVIELVRSEAPRRWTSSDFDCEMQYWLGRTYRKKRKYNPAEENLRAVVERCAEPWKKKAGFHRARVTSYRRKTNYSILHNFVKTYPNDSLSDDVLIWTAKSYLDEGRTKDALKIFKRVVDEYPQGDQSNYARFQFAFRNATIGQRSLALETLAQGLQLDAHHVKVLEHDQWRYWHGRLLAFPRLDTFEINALDEEAFRGLCELQNLAQERSFSFYGTLAENLLAQVAKSQASILQTCPDAANSAGGFAKSFWEKRRERTQKGASNALKEQSKTLEDLGLHRLAQETKEALKSQIDIQGVQQTAHAQQQRGDLGRAHRTMRNAGFALLPGSPAAERWRSSGHANPWALAYPLAYQKELHSAARAIDLDPLLIQSIAREESAFNPVVTSWAGALGLCQLMPATAREEAKRAKIQYDTDEDLKEPSLNAQLGANHLARRMRQLKHPFLATAAYNAGPGNVKKWRTSAFPKTLDAWVESIPVSQTRGYVKKVMGSWSVYRKMYGDPDSSFPMLLP